MTFQLPPGRMRGSIGFRLAHELDGLLDGITADHVITDEERDRLLAWLDANRVYRDVHPFSQLGDHLEAVLADGLLTMEEAEDLLFVVRRYTTVNPHFDALRGGIQSLLGLVAGMAADGELHEHELARLSAWMAEWEHLKSLFPYDECDALVTTLRTGGPQPAAIERFHQLVHELPVAGDGGLDASSLTIRGVCAVNPLIEFPARTFVFTGESAKGTRAVLEEHVRQRGGLTHGRVTRDTHYVVVCDGSNPLWAFSCYGRKVEQAYMLRKQGHPVQLIHEVDFWDATY